MLSQQESQQDESARQQDEAAEELSDLLDLAAGAPVGVETRRLRSMLQQVGGDAPNEGEDDSEEDTNIPDDHEPEADGMEEDDVDENADDDDLLQFLEDDHDSDDFASIPSEGESGDENDSVVMADVDTTLAKSQRAADQPRTVLVSSDDL